MKIVDRATFLTMPAGTVYQKYDENGFHRDGLQIKDDPRGSNDWYCVHIDAESLLATDDDHPGYEHLYLTMGKSVALEINATADGLFEADVQFVILDHDDVRKLRDLLTESLRLTGGEA